MRGTAILLAALVVAALTPGSAGVASAAPPRGVVPPEFFGVVPQGPLGAADWGRMQGVVETLRIPVYWSECEPAPGVYDFGTVDAVVGAAARHGIRVQPFVYGSPAWLTPDRARPPSSTRARSAWAAFLRALVGRYGSRGEFWRGRPEREPILLWQVWNEPNFLLFWHPRPSPRAYARLLHVSAAAIRGADPRARIVLAGVAPVSAGIKTWIFLRRLFRVPGVRHDFDLVALHPYSATLSELEYQVRMVRGAMAGAGLAARQLLVSEVGVASQGEYPSAFVEGPDGQARFLRVAYARLLQMRHRWRIAGIDWFTWKDEAKPDPNCAFCQGAGLLDLDGRPKPAWWSLREIVTRLRRPVH